MADTGTPRIVIGERSSLMRRLLGDPLRESGWEVLEAKTGAETLRRIREELPDVVLLARELEVMSGMEVLDAVVGDLRTASIPVLFVTGRAGSGELARGLERGAHDYVRKPFDPEEVVARVRNARRLRRLYAELEERNAELERLARTDRLTGLANRLHAEEVLAEAEADGSPFAVVVTDIDRFKAVNDGHGHAAGDAVLREVARRLTAGVREHDMAARWGGEEFLLVLRTGEDPAIVCERLRAAVAAAAVVTADGRPVAVTASFGWAPWSPATTAEQAVARADAALYRAKVAGRDRVEADDAA